MKASSDRGISFSDFYFSYAAGTIIVAVVSFFAFGDGRTFYCPNESSWSSKDSHGAIAAAVGSGTIFNVANILLTLGIKYAGLSLAFPVGIGTALIGGTLATYVLDPNGNSPYLLFSGVLLGAIAVCAAAAAAHFKEKSSSLSIASPETNIISSSLLPPLEEDSREKISTPASPATRLGLTHRFLLCAAAGVCMSCWSPLNALALADTDKDCSSNVGKLTAYSAFLFYCIAVAITSVPLCVFVLPQFEATNKNDTAVLVAEAVGGHKDAPLLMRFAFGCVGGVIWSIGTLSNSLAGMHLGLALSYAVGQAAPMVATTWGLFYYGEYAGCSDRRSYICLFAMYVLFIGAIGLIAASK